MLKWLTFDPDYSINQDLLSGSGFAKYCYLDPEQEKAMLEGALKLLLTLLSIKTHLGKKYSSMKMNKVYLRSHTFIKYMTE